MRKETRKITFACYFRYIFLRERLKKNLLRSNNFVCERIQISLFRWITLSQSAQHTVSELVILYCVAVEKCMKKMSGVSVEETIHQQQDNFSSLQQLF